MGITAILLAHYKQRQSNLKRIVDDLLAGTVRPETVCIFVDDPEIDFSDDRVTIIRSDHSFLPRIRFSLGSYFESDYCFFVDDDLTVNPKTLENLVEFSKKINDPRAILGMRGSILGDTPTPYANDVSIKSASELTEVDIVLRTYFVPRLSMFAGSWMQAEHPDLPSVSLDDVYLCLGNKYLNGGKNYVIPIDQETSTRDLPEEGVGQSVAGLHYENRNKVTRYLKDYYDVLGS